MLQGMPISGAKSFPLLSKKLKGYFSEDLLRKTISDMQVSIHPHSFFFYLRGRGDQGLGAYHTRDLSYPVTDKLPDDLGIRR